MYIQLQITPAAKAVPAAMVFQSLNILSQNAETLQETVDAFLLSNPMVDFAPQSSGENSFDISQMNSPSQPALADYLTDQLHSMKQPPELRRVAAFIIDSLDKDGYLRDAEDEVIHAARTSPACFQAALALVQTLEPIGVGARCLSECLRLQLEAQDEPCPLAIEIVSHQLEALASATLQLDGYTQEEIAQACARIRALQPRPGLPYHYEATHYIVPDIRIDADEQGGLTATLINQPAAPSLNARYHEFLKTDNAEQRQYIQENLLYARSFLHALQERAKTLLKIAAFAANCQAEYLLTKTPSTLRPMTLASLARETGLHRSTVSRAIACKYMEFQGRVFPFRSLFTSGGTQKHSRDEILHRIQKLLAAAPDDSTLCDTKITELLCEEGIQISRRTVNKYRNLYLKDGEKDNNHLSATKGR